MSEMRDRLRTLLNQHNDLMLGTDWRARLEELQKRREAGEFEIDKVVPGTLVESGGGQFFLVRRDFPLDARRGGIALGAVLEAMPEHIALAACDPDLDAFDPFTALFVDVETTGLSGGTGTIAFLVGAGYFHEGMFRLDQCFMRDFDDEAPMLHFLDGLFRGKGSVVTYNGKSFDIPLLRTRFISNRMPFRLDSALHFDLVHASRRFWRQRLKDCSLGNVERSILGVQRHGDVDSAEIPQLWFDYLRSRDARKLDRVFNHHQCDILSLVALTAWLAQCLETPQGEGFEHAEDRLSLIRVHFRQKRFEAVVSTAEKLLEAEAEAAVRHECLELLGCACKRLQNWERMGQVWDLMLREFPQSILPRLELAKLHEHRTRDLAEAERLCAETIGLLETRATLGRDDGTEPSYLEPLRQRLERIRRKMSKYRPE